VADYAICIYGERKRRRDIVNPKTCERRPRSTSPETHVDNEWARSQYPAGSFYSDDGRVDTFNKTNCRNKSVDEGVSWKGGDMWKDEEPLYFSNLHPEGGHVGSNTPMLMSGGVEVNKYTAATDNRKSYTSFEQNAPELGNVDTTEIGVLPRWEPWKIFPSRSPNSSAEERYEESREKDIPAITADNRRLKSTQPSDEPHMNSSYQYSSVPSSVIRLLRISPGQHDDTMVCALKPILVERIKASVLAFQALSYSWDSDNVAESHIALYDLIASSGMGQASRSHRLQKRNLYITSLRFVTISFKH
jgi:hypothetical protein